MKFTLVGVPAVLIAVLVGALLAITDAKPASATTLMRMSPASLMDKAELIFAGEVLDVSSAAVSDGSYAFTFVTFEVDETFKGEVEGSRLVLRFDGGEIGDAVIEYEGMPSFQAGQRVLLFVKGNGTVGCPVLGWWQGRLDFLSTAEGSVLVDSSGAVVTGLEQGEWLRVSRQQLQDHRDGTAAEPGVEVLWTDGVEIEAPALESLGQPRLLEAEEVLEVLRGQMRGRSLMKSFQLGMRVESADVEDIPSTVQIRPTAALVVQ